MRLGACEHCYTQGSNRVSDSPELGSNTGRVTAVDPGQAPKSRSPHTPAPSCRMSETPPTKRRFGAPSPERRRALLEKPTVVLGAGPAGLTAGYLLAKEGLPVIVLEAHEKVGGLAMTEERDGYRFDLGGHRFFTKSKEVDDLWHEVLDEEFLLRPRMSRIYWNKRYLDYPLRGPDVIRKLGPVELTRAFFSYLVAAVKPKGNEESLEEWVSNRFGKRLFTLF